MNSHYMADQQEQTILAQSEGAYPAPSASTYVDALMAASAQAHDYLLSLHETSNRSLFPNATVGILHHDDPQLWSQRRNTVTRYIGTYIPPRRLLNDRERFAVFVKILLKCLRQSGDQEVYERTKRIIKFCTLRNRMGDTEYSPLIHATELRLQRIVGYEQWSRATRMCDTFCRPHVLKAV